GLAGHDQRSGPVDDYAAPEPAVGVRVDDRAAPVLGRGADHVPLRARDVTDDLHLPVELVAPHVWDGGEGAPRGVGTGDVPGDETRLVHGVRPVLAAHRAPRVRGVHPRDVADGVDA